MTAHSNEGNSAGALKVVFADLNIDQPPEVGAVFEGVTVFWPQQVFDAAVDSSVLLNRELLDVVQRNLNASFSLLRKLVGARSLGEVIELQAAHMSNQVTALIGQSEELTALSVRTATEFMQEAYPRR